ncbi:hypothetical protein GLOIN_2v205859 [Rhizophagus irregularis DAOM 181602=DAOM 197198]|nr:hypothetical protein GLOIN_2v205859 [Rhizophagus irregularis DAOM 181602=DAOM 197198]
MCNDHLKKCIARTAKRRSTSIQKNTKKEIEEIYLTYCFKFSKGLSIYSYADDYETWKKHVNHLIDTVKSCPTAWRAFKLRPETWAKRVWNMVRNDGTPDKKKFLSPRGKRDIYDPYVWYIDRKILAKDLPESFLNNLYDGHIPREWARKEDGYRILNITVLMKYYNNGNVNFVKSSEYARYRCKITGKPYPCDSLEIDYFKSEYDSLSK